MRNVLWVDFIIVNLGGLADEEVNVARVDLVGGGIIDEGESRAGVVSDGLALGGFHVFSDFCTAVSVAEHVHVAIVEAGENDGFGVHHGGDEAEQFRLEAGVVDFKVGFQRLAAESALGGMFQPTHIA